MSGISGFEKPNLNVGLRVHVALGGLVFCFFLLALRLWYLQILKGTYFRERSENNLIRTIYVPPPRGLVMDRHGEVIAKNRPSFNIDLVTEDSPDPKSTLTVLAEILGYEPTLLHERIKDQKKRRRFEPKLILKDISRDMVAKVAARRHDLPGIIINVTPTRDYVFGGLASHVLGYIREITRDQLDSPAYAGYRPGELVGQYGTEKKWERILHGETGYQDVIVNASGTKMGERSLRSEIAGHNVMLTIDATVQRAADAALVGKRGGIVAMDPNTGEILALSSGPTFDPNIFTGEIPAEVWTDMISGRDKKLNNRVIQGEYPPGSTFKIFMAVAALSEGVMTKNETVFCPGYFYFGGRSFRCHKHSGHGQVNMHTAMVQSCDVYFYTAGHRLGVDRIHEYGSQFGLGIAPGLDLVQERAGILPSTEWKRRYFKKPEDKKWYPGETISVAIGQGATTTTPLQLARGVSTLVNGGRLLKPFIERQMTHNDGKVFDDKFGPAEVGRLTSEPWVIDHVRNSLVGVVNEPRGTGGRAKLDKRFPVIVAGKTGTAQAAALIHEHKEQFKDHAWFVGYAPADKPEIVVAALVENGGHGGATSAPLVRQVMEAYFSHQYGSEPAPEKKPQEAVDDANLTD